MNPLNHAPPSSTLLHSPGVDDLYCYKDYWSHSIPWSTCQLCTSNPAAGTLNIAHEIKSLFDRVLPPVWMLQFWKTVVS